MWRSYGGAHHAGIVSGQLLRHLRRTDLVDPQNTVVPGFAIGRIEFQRAIGVTQGFDRLPLHPGGIAAANKTFSRSP